MRLSQMTTFLTVGLIVTACSDAPQTEAETLQSEATHISATEDTEQRISSCLEEAIQQAKDDFGMSDEEIRSEIEGLKSDCAILIESDRRIEAFQDRIDAANAEQAAITDEFIRQAEERRKHGE